MKLFSLFLLVLVQMVSLASNDGGRTSNHVTNFELIITEVFADPSPSFGLPEVEYVEIYNRSQQILDLSDYEFYDGSLRVLKEVEIFPGEYVIICDDEDTVELIPYGKVAWVSSLSLTNSGESLAIYSIQGDLIDSIKYSSSWYDDTFKKDGGWSLERIDRDFTCYDPGNWQPSKATIGGTPGAENSINGVFTDFQEPVVLHAFPISANEVVLVFSESVDINSGNGNISAPGLNPVNITGYYNGNSNKLLLNMNASIKDGFIYTIFVDGFEDCIGNTSESDSVYFGLHDTTSVINRLLINEILYDPLDGCPEFIEVINGSDKIINLSDYKTARLDIETGSIISSYDIADDIFILLPDALAVICKNTKQLTECYYTSYPKRMILSHGMPSLLNGEGRIGILQHGIITDDLLYDDDLHHPLLSGTQGVSLERITVGKPNTGSNWHSASSVSGFATPGFPNSQRRMDHGGDDWVSLDPQLFSPDNDGYSDVLSINIKASGPDFLILLKIFDPGGRIIKEFDSETLSTGDNKIIWNGLNDNDQLVDPGPYILFAEMYNPFGQMKRDKQMLVVAFK